MAARKIANKGKTKKPGRDGARGSAGRGNPNWHKGGPSPNPKGRPPEGESWAAVIKQISNMTGEEAASYFAAASELMKPFRKLTGITLKEAVVARCFAALLFEPQAAMLNALMDRAEGKLAQTIRTWRDEVIELLKTGKVTPDIVRDELGDELATELLIAAGVPVAASGQNEAASEDAGTNAGGTSSHSVAG